MTNPVDITALLPSKAKTWVGLIGSLLTFIGPLVLSSTDALPAPWPAIIGVVFAVLTALGIYHAPYKPAGTVLAPEEILAQLPPSEVPLATPDNPSPPIADVAPPQVPGGYANPWRDKD